MKDELGFFLQAEDGIRELVRSRGLGDVYKRQAESRDDDHHGNALPQLDCGAGYTNTDTDAYTHALSLIHI